MDRALLPEPRWGEKLIRPYLPPQSRLEMEVQLILKAVLNKKEMISCDADFSAIGGNMMHAVIANGIVRYDSSSLRRIMRYCLGIFIFLSVAILHLYVYV